jgi:aspartyl-tRNA(Asn)/glutamyl-tRNA(Gln) amidotransferase subunit A
MASSTDVIGPLTKTVEDAAIILDVISGKDALDSTTIERDQSSYVDLASGIKGKKFGVIKECFDEGLDGSIRSAIEKQILMLKDNGAEVVEVSLPSSPLALACYYVICPAEVSSNLNRYDGQRYGFSDNNAKNLEESYELSRSRGFGPEAKRRIMIGTYVLSSGYYDAYYKKAQTVRTKLIDEYNDAFSKVNFLLCPTAPTTAFKIGENITDPMQMYLNDIYSVGPSLVGLPAISLPVAKADGLPIGMQIMAPQKHDRELLEVSNEIERINK